MEKTIKLKRIAGVVLSAVIVALSFLPMVYVGQENYNVVDFFMHVDVGNGNYIALTVAQVLILLLYLANIGGFCLKREAKWYFKLISYLGVGSTFIIVPVTVSMRASGPWEAQGLQNVPLVSALFMFRWFIMVLEFINRRYGDKIWRLFLAKIQSLEHTRRLKRKEIKNMVRRVFWKGFRKNRRNFILLSLSGIVLISILFSTTALGDLLTQAAQGKESDMVSEYVTISSFIMVYVLLLFLLILSIICYMRSRTEEYAAYQILGIKKKHRNQFIAKEFGMFGAVSLIGGISLGVLEAKIIEWLLGEIYPEKAGQFLLTISPFKMTIIIGIIGFGLIFMICDEFISCLGVSQVLSLGTGSGKRPKSHPVSGSVGIVLCIGAVCIMQNYWGRASKIYPMLIAAVGIYLLYIAAGGLLTMLRRNEKRYYKAIIWINTWYYRFYHNMNMMFIITIFVFVTLFSYALPLLDSTPLDTSEHYPYDIVWTAHKEDIPFLDELEEKYGAEITRQPSIRVSTPDFGVHMGISASAFRELTGEKAELKGKQIYVIYQREHASWNSLGMDYGASAPRLHMGKPEAYLWINTPLAGPIPSARFDTCYPVKKEEDRTVTGIFKSSNDENIVVFSDEYFNTVKDAAKGSNMMALINTPQKHDEVMRRIKEYIADTPYPGETIRLFDKKQLVADNKQARILDIGVYAIGFVILMGCTIFVIGAKVSSDSVEMEEKYYFYDQMGIKERMRKQGVKRECSMTVWVPIFVGLAAGIAFVLRELALRQFPADWTAYYLKGVAVLLVIMLAAYAGTALAINRQMLMKTDNSAK